MVGTERESERQAISRRSVEKENIEIPFNVCPRVLNWDGELRHQEH